jgi:serine/threonine protein kinase
MNYKTNPHNEYELIQKIGSGTYGDVYKVSLKDENQKNKKIAQPKKKILGKKHTNGRASCD